MSVDGVFVILLWVVVDERVRGVEVVVLVDEV
jgi:hypothetical protein